MVDEDAWVHRLPGLVVQGSSVWLTQQPSAPVTIATQCDPTTAIVIAPDSWETPQLINMGKCDVLECASKDRRYDGLHVRIADADEKIGEWVPEEVFEADEGPSKVLAALERSRSAFKFRNAVEFDCKKKLHVLVCVLPNTTVPFFVADPKGGLDEDGWNSFPVVLIIAAGHPTSRGLAGVHAATHIAQHWRPRRGRLIVVPNLNSRLGASSASSSSSSSASLQRSSGNNGATGEADVPFPVDLGSDFAASQPSAPLAQALWRLCAVLRPDLYYDLEEFSALELEASSQDGYVVASPEAVPLAEVMVKESGQKLSISELPLIAGGLAVRLRTAFRTRAIVVHSKFDPSVSLGMRATALLHMVAACMETLRIMGNSFQWQTPSLKDCVALDDDDCVTDATIEKSEARVTDSIANDVEVDSAN